MKRWRWRLAFSVCLCVLAGLSAAFLQVGGRLVAKEAVLTVRVSDTGQALRALEQVSTRFNGQTASSTTWAVEDQGRGFQAAALTLRFPAGEFEAALAAVRALGVEVLAETVTGTDRTQEILDLEMRQRALESERERLSELAARQETADARRVREELLRAEDELLQVTVSLGELRERVKWGTISVELEPLIPTVTPRPKPGRAPTVTPGPTALATRWNPDLTYQKGVRDLVRIVPIAVGCGGPLLLVGVVLILVVRTGPKKGK